MAASKDSSKNFSSKKSLENKNLRKIVAALKAEFSPLRLFLFGSRASGTVTSKSDYDFVVVVKRRHGDRIDNMLRAKAALVSLGIKADVFVYSEKEFNEWKNEFSSIPETAVNTGRELSLE